MTQQNGQRSKKRGNEQTDRPEIFPSCPGGAGRDLARNRQGQEAAAPQQGESASSCFGASTGSAQWPASQEEKIASTPSSCTSEVPSPSLPPSLASLAGGRSAGDDNFLLVR